MSQLVLLDQVRVNLGGNTVLRDLGFQLDGGQVAGVTGPNGSGKTTLVRVIATLIGIDGGTGHVLDADLSSSDVYRVRQSIGLISHNPTVLDHLSLGENLDHAARLTGIDNSRVSRALHTVGLEEVADRRAHASSFGMLRRLEVARLLLTRPRLLLLDEATSGLDSEASQLIGALIEATVSRGGGVIVVSHDVAQLEEVCEDIHHLALGRLGPLA